MKVMHQYKPDVVYHAAAHKHVPLMETRPSEAILNNIVGTKNVIEACIDCDVSRFIMISTDKAVNPTNVMGATKRMTELIMQSRKTDKPIKMAAVRFGNVLGSNGSVIPIFKEQITVQYIISLIIMLLATGIIIFDTLFKNHTHFHEHQVSYVENGEEKTKTITHKHFHFHFNDKENHNHKHYLK